MVAPSTTRSSNNSSTGLSWRRSRLPALPAPQLRGPDPRVNRGCDRRFERPRVGCRLPEILATGDREDSPGNPDRPRPALIGITEFRFGVEVRATKDENAMLAIPSDELKTIHPLLPTDDRTTNGFKAQKQGGHLNGWSFATGAARAAFACKLVVRLRTPQPPANAEFAKVTKARKALYGASNRAVLTPAREARNCHLL